VNHTQKITLLKEKKLTVLYFFYGWLLRGQVFYFWSDNVIVRRIWMS